MIAQEFRGAVLPGGGHICMIVDDDQGYTDLAADFLRTGSSAREKTVAFGPLGSAGQERLASLADVVADPYVDVLDLRPLEPERMLAMFREQTALAAAEGFARVRVAADMDWLLPAGPSGEEAIEFEVLLDRVASELDATVLCAYRRTSFERVTLLGMACTHPIVVTSDVQPPFKLVAGAGGRWVLSGEIDIACTSVLAAALRATATSRWVVDVAGLDFIDIAGMRTIALTAAEVGLTLELCGARPQLRRLWSAVGFEAVPQVRIVD